MAEASGSSKVAKGSAVILIGNIIFRVGGYIYRFLMASLLGPAAYGILGLTTPFQGIFQVLSAAGLPPAIAKYVSEYKAINEEDLARQTIFTALKIMVFFSFPHNKPYRKTSDNASINLETIFIRFPIRAFQRLF